MNERIRKLLNEATSGLEPDISPQRTVTLNEMEKFAELIVRECAKFLDENSGYDDSNNAWHTEPEDLLKHFGVE